MQVCTETVNFVLEGINKMKEQTIAEVITTVERNPWLCFQQLEQSGCLRSNSTKLCQLWKGRGGLAEIVKLIRE